MFFSKKDKIAKKSAKALQIEYQNGYIEIPTVLKNYEGDKDLSFTIVSDLEDIAKIFQDICESKGINIRTPEHKQELADILTCIVNGAEKNYTRDAESHNYKSLKNAYDDALSRTRTLLLERFYPNAVQDDINLGSRSNRIGSRL